MNPKLSCFALFGTTLVGSLAAEPIPQPQVIFSASPGVTWTADWQGVTGRTYFSQWSSDLAVWNFFPSVDFGTGIKSQGGLNPASKFFFRLKYTDENWVSTLQEARDADFDGDGIPNYFEVEVVGSDPFDPNSNGGDEDGDGLADGWEKFHFGGLGVADPNAKLFPDGLTNKEKSELGIGPLADDLSLPAQRITYSYDGERLDGVNYYTQREFSYELDDNGNVETTTSD